jgi:hypothetical protein
MNGGELEFGDLVSPATATEMERAHGSIRALRATSDLRDALPELLARLERLRRAELDPELHVGLLSVYLRPVLQAVRTLPKPAGLAAKGPASAGPGEVVSSEQRLIGSMAANLQLAVENLNRTRQMAIERSSRFERWAVSHLFAFLERQVRYGVCLRRPLPGNTWLQIHDAFHYLLGRGKASLDPRAGLSQSDPRRDPAVLYLRLLLLGVVGEHTQVPRPINLWYEALWPMALESHLTEPEAHLGEFGLYLVETSFDRPPRFLPGALNDTFRGWILSPGKVFREEMALLDADAPG